MEAIVARNVSKRFRLHHKPVWSLKERVLRLGRQGYEDFWALRTIDLDVAEGETVGILGHNGSGKSTLLKCIAGILKPTTGNILQRGRIASLLELGAGFSPDLTGRENVFINASFLGIPQQEITRRFDEIVAFSELEQFIDQQVKYYSSGMFVRLGFAVAVNVDPDILLVDEVLAVGDEVFKRKCLDRVAEFQREGRTILFVTHDVDLSRTICNRVVVLDHGNMVANGPPGESIRIFREHLHGLPPTAEDETAAPTRDQSVRITGITIEHPASPDRPYVTAGEPAVIRIAYDAAAAPVRDVVVELSVVDASGRLLWRGDTDRLGTPLPPLVGRGDVAFHIGAVPLLDGAFPLIVQITERGGGRLLDWSELQHSLAVVNPSRVEGLVHLPVQTSVTMTAEHRAAG